MYRSRSMTGTSSPLSSRKIATELAIITAAALVLAVLGPFGTWETSFGHRLQNWAMFAFGGYACFRPVIAGGNALAAQSMLPRWIAIVIACLIASLPTTLIVTLVFAGQRWREISAGGLAALYPQVLIVGGTVTLIQLLVGGSAPINQHHDLVIAEVEPASDIETIVEPRRASASFLDQLPLHLGRDLLCIENEDHYIRVHTTVGNALILMRLRDAVAQLSEIDGAQVHRAWWVAKSAVAAVAKRDRRILLKLIDGREVPVSRASAPLLRVRGWL